MLTVSPLCLIHSSPLCSRFVKHDVPEIKLFIMPSGPWAPNHISINYCMKSQIRILLLDDKHSPRQCSWLLEVSEINYVILLCPDKFSDCWCLAAPIIAVALYNLITVVLFVGWNRVLFVGWGLCCPRTLSTSRL